MAFLVTGNINLPQMINECELLFFVLIVSESLPVILNMLMLYTRSVCSFPAIHGTEFTPDVSQFPGTISARYDFLVYRNFGSFIFLFFFL